MKSNSTPLPNKIYAFVTIFLSSAGLGYALINQFLLNKPNTSLLIIFACLFVVYTASWQRKKLAEKNINHY